MYIRQLVILFVLFFVAFPAMVSAQSVSIAVLGINSVDAIEGDEEVSRNITSLLRQELGLRGFSVSHVDISLVQAQAVIECQDRNIDCLNRISESLITNALVFGTMRRVNTDVDQEIEIELHYFDFAAHRIVAHYTGRIAINPISEMVTALAQVAASALTERLRASTDVPPVATVPRTVEPTVSYNRAWVGWGLIGLGVAFLVADIPVWTRIDSINSDPSMIDYRYRLGLGAGDACTNADAGNILSVPGLDPVSAGTQVDHVRGLCSEGATLEVLQYVFLVLGLASAGLGTTLLATGMLVSPSVSTDHAALTVSGSF